MIDSFYSRNNCRKSFDNMDSYLSMISHNQNNSLNPMKPFNRSSLIFSFYKENRLQFLNNPHCFCFYYNKIFLFCVEKAYIDYSLIFCSFTRKYFLCGVVKKKTCFFQREAISLIESQVKYHALFEPISIMFIIPRSLP